MEKAKNDIDHIQLGNNGKCLPIEELVSTDQTINKKTAKKE